MLVAVPVVVLLELIIDDGNSILLLCSFVVAGNSMKFKVLLFLIAENYGISRDFKPY